MTVYTLSKPCFSANISRTCFLSAIGWTAARRVQEAHFNLRIGHADRGSGLLSLVFFPGQ